jgi:hypothetical protein
LHLLIEKAHILKANDLIDRVQVIQNRKGNKEELTTRQIEALVGIPVCKVIRNNYSETRAASREGRAVQANSALGAEFKAFAAELCGKPIRSRNSFRKIWAAFTKKTRVSEMPQTTGTDRADTRALVAFRPLLALPEPEPKALVRYHGSTRATRRSRVADEDTDIILSAT